MKKLVPFTCVAARNNKKSIRTEDGKKITHLQTYVDLMALDGDSAQSKPANVVASGFVDGIFYAWDYLGEVSACQLDELSGGPNLMIEEEVTETFCYVVATLSWDNKVRFGTFFTEKEAKDYQRSMGEIAIDYHEIKYFPNPSR